MANDDRLIKVPLNRNTGGLDLRSNEADQSLNSALDLDGVMLSQKGSILNFPGRAEKITTGLGGRPVKYQTIFLDDSVNPAKEVPILYVDNGTTAEWFKADFDLGTVTSLGTVTVGGVVNAVQFKNDLIITSSAHVPQVSANLGALANLAGYPPNYGTPYNAAIDLTEWSDDPANFSVPTQPDKCEAHVNRTWIADRKLLMGSVLHKDSTWTSTATSVLRHWYANINPSDGLGDFVQIKRWNDYLSIFKQKGIYLLEGTHPRGVTGNNPFNVIRTPATVGLAGPQALDRVLNDIVFLDNNGYAKLLSNTILKPDAIEADIGERVQPVFDKIPKDKLKDAWVRTFPRLNQVWFGFENSTGAVAGQKNAVAIWDYRVDNWTKAENIILPASLNVVNNKFYTGTYDGKIHQQISGNTHGLTQRYSKYVWSWIYASGVRFGIPRIELWFSGVTAGKLLVEVTFQDRKGQYYPINFTAQDAALYDVSKFDESYFGSGTGRTLIKKTIFPSGSGFRAQIKLYSEQEGFAWEYVDGLAYLFPMGHQQV